MESAAAPAVRLQYEEPTRVAVNFSGRRPWQIIHRDKPFGHFQIRVLQSVTEHFGVRFWRTAGIHENQRDGDASERAMWLRSGGRGHVT